MISTIFIDLDNTLLDFHESARQSMRNGFLDFGIPYDDSMFPVFTETNNALWEEIERGNLTKERLLLVRWNKIFDKLGIEFDGVLFEKKFREYLSSSACLIDGALELLQYLSAKYKVYIVTNGFVTAQSGRLQKSGFLPYLSGIFVSEAAGCAKPKKGFFDYCFAALDGVTAEETVVIGDSLSADILGGIEYGLKTCWYNPNGLPVPMVDIDYIVKDLCEIKAYL